MSSKTDFSVLGLPIHDVPLFEERQGKDWVTYGADDRYGEYLEGLFLGSSINSAIISGVGAMIYGEGLDATDRDASDGHREQWVRLQRLLSSSDPELLRKLALDLKLYGQCYINTIWNRSRTELAQLKHLPVHTLRAGVCDSTGKIDVWYYKNDWTDKEKPLTIRSFDDEDRTEASRVLQIKRYAPSYHYYGLPDYVGSTGYIDLDQEIQSFHLNNIKNGLFPSMMLSFTNGVPTDQERAQIERKVQDKFSGADNAGKLLITFNDGPETAPQFTPISTNGSDAMYEYLSREVTTKVLSGHRVTSPLLFGVRAEGGGFGSNADELRDSYSLFTNTVVVPFQDLLLRGMAPIWTANNITLDLYFKPFKPADFLNLTPEEESGEVVQAGWELSATNDHECATPEELISGGEDPDIDDYELIDSRKVDYDEEVKLDGFTNLASVISGSQKGSDDQDNALFKIRYQYAPLKVDLGVTGQSRSFCKKMVAAAKVYKKRDIEAAEYKSVNPGFGRGGSNTYNVWFYKGGPRCHHYWMRLTYLRKSDRNIYVNEARRIINGLPPEERDAVRLPVNDWEVAVLPNDMDYKGFDPSNPNIPEDAINKRRR